MFKFEEWWEQFDIRGEEYCECEGKTFSVKDVAEMAFEAGYAKRCEEELA